MAANTDPTKCTHPNTAIPTIVDGGWDIPRIGGENEDGSLRTIQGQAIQVRYNCPDCEWELRRGFINPDEIKAPTISADEPTGSAPDASVVISWTAIGGVDSWKIEKSTDGGSTWVSGTPATAAKSATSSTQTGLDAGTIKFRVKAVDEGVDSAVSNEVTVTIPE